MRGAGVSLWAGRLELMRFIVGEVSKNWIGGAELHPEKGLIAEQFEVLINVNAARGYRLVTFSLHRLITNPDQMNETIIAVFEEVKA